MNKKLDSLKNLPPDFVESHKALMEFLDNDPDHIAVYHGTLLVCAKELGEFIMDHTALVTLPTRVLHLLALTWNAYAMIFDKDRLIKNKMDVDFQNYFESGGIDDRFAMVVKQLYEICKEKKLL
jgi:hypothetical protein